MATAVVAPTYGAPEVLTTVTVDVPAPGPGEVTIEVRAAAVNPYDAKVVGGQVGEDPDALPLRVGSEVAGVVTAVGEGATGPAGEVRVGDEVIGYPVAGAWASAVTVPAASVVPKPAGLGFEEASGLLLTGVTAYHLLEATALTRADTVLVHGVSGGVGWATAQLALDRGARVVGTASSARHDELRALGVVPVAYGEGLADRVREAAPDGIDVALDTVGTDEAVDVSLALVADRRRIATIAAFDRAEGAGIQLLGGSEDPGTQTRARGRLVVADLAERGRLGVVVAATYALEDAGAALALVAGGRAGGKVVLVP